MRENKKGKTDRQKERDRDRQINRQIERERERQKRRKQRRPRLVEGREKGLEGRRVIANGAPSYKRPLVPRCAVLQFTNESNWGCATREALLLLSLCLPSNRQTDRQRDRQFTMDLFACHPYGFLLLYVLSS